MMSETNFRNYRNSTIISLIIKMVLQDFVLVAVRGIVQGKINEGTGKMPACRNFDVGLLGARVNSPSMNVKSPTMNVKSPTVNVNSTSAN